jgi:hypothetical protein
MNDYRDALEDCLQTLRRGGDVQAAIARYPTHAAELRNDIALAAAVRSAGSRVETPAGAQGRAGLRMAAALREARAAQAPTTTAPKPGLLSGLSGFLRPLAIATVALVVLAVGLGAIGGLGGGGTAEASTLEGVVVENKDGLLTVQTNTGLESVSFEKTAVVQDDSARNVAVSDISVGQVVKVQGKRGANGPFIAKQLLSKPAAEIKAFCAQHGDACQQLLPRLEAQINACVPAGSPACQRLQQPLQDTRIAVQMITADMSQLNDRCGNGGSNACKAFERACKMHPVICSELRKRFQGGNNNGPGGPNRGPGNNQQRPQGPGRPQN